MRVLVVDDDDVAREALATILRSAGHEVSQLSSPIGVSRAIQEQSVQVVVIDVFLPGMKGDRLAKLLRGNPRFERVGVVLVSGDAAVDLERLANEVGADALTDKASAKKSLCRSVELAARRRKEMGQEPGQIR
jgi:CheY-like chemotaxis protein